jgi:hypothetical protein
MKIDLAAFRAARIEKPDGDMLYPFDAGSGGLGGLLIRKRNGKYFPFASAKRAFANLADAEAALFADLGPSLRQRS